MTNIQLYQKFVDDKVFDKTHQLSLGCLVTFAKVSRMLNDGEKESICYAIDKISEYRNLENKIPADQRT